MSQLSPLETSIPVLRPERAEPVGGSGSVGQTFENALREVEALQRTADTEAEKVALGGGNLHETALALEKADIGMRVATKVRNKLVEAYMEVMRMNV